MLLAKLLRLGDLYAEALVAGALQCLCAAGSPAATAAAAALLRRLEPGPRALQALEGFLAGGGGAGLSATDRAALCMFVSNLRTAGARPAADQRSKEAFHILATLCVHPCAKKKNMRLGNHSIVCWLSYTSFGRRCHAHAFVARQRREAARVVPRRCSGLAACRPACWHSCRPPALPSMCALTLPFVHTHGMLCVHHDKFCLCNLLACCWAVHTG